MRNRKEVTREDFSTAYRESDGLILIDVRSPLEYKSKHITGSINIPLDQVSIERVEELLQEQNVSTDTAVYLICKSGMRSRAAQKKMQGSSRQLVCVDKGLDGLGNASGIDFKQNKTESISLERQVRIAIGSLIVIGILLGTLIHPAGYVFSGLVGLGFLISGITDWCGLALLLAKMPWNRTLPC